MGLIKKKMTMEELKNTVYLLCIAQYESFVSNFESYHIKFDGDLLYVNTIFLISVIMEKAAKDNKINIPADLTEKMRGFINNKENYTKLINKYIKLIKENHLEDTVEFFLKESRAEGAIINWILKDRIIEDLKKYKVVCYEFLKDYKIVE